MDIAVVPEEAIENVSPLFHSGWSQDEHMHMYKHAVVPEEANVCLFLSALA